MTTATTTRTPWRLRARWRVVDIVVASVIGVALGLVFFAWDQVYGPVTAPLDILFNGMGALAYGVWLVAGVLGALIIRKPGAAIYVEVLAATVEALLGAKWGFLTFVQGLAQGLAAELVFLAFLYLSWRLVTAILAGAAAGLAMAIFDLIIYYPGSGPVFASTHTVSAIISGAVIAGVGSWLLARAIARTGALSRFASGRTASARG